MQYPKNQHRNPSGGYSGPGRDSGHSHQEDWLKNFKSEWITKGIDRETISFAEKLGKKLADKHQGISSSQIRNVFGEMKRIQMSGFENEKTAFLLLLPKLSYAKVRNDKPGISILKEVFDKMHSLVTSKENYENMMKIMEAILAFHRAFGGKE